MVWVHFGIHAGQVRFDSNSVHHHHFPPLIQDLSSIQTDHLYQEQMETNLQH